MKDYKTADKEANEEAQAIQKKIKVRLLYVSRSSIAQPVVAFDAVAREGAQKQPDQSTRVLRSHSS